ncbi:MAG TPA: hypothetical protein VES40_12765 [Ilumatobacteraceae bacterium]|nr:hypothetical protein [Ilumatobacteraceae bacterium]
MSFARTASVDAILPVQPVDVSAILRPIGSDLVSNEVIAADHVERNTIRINGHTTRPSIIELDTSP